MSLPKTQSRAETTGSGADSTDCLDEADAGQALDGNLTPVADAVNKSSSRTLEKAPGPKTVEVPLSSDSAFFQILNKELSILNDLQERERNRLTQEIVLVGNEVKAISDAASSSAKSDLNTWREIFRLYTESQVFFSTGERDAGMRNSTSAQKQLQSFTDVVARQKRGFKLKKSSKASLDRFLRVNVELLRNLRFHEINSLALTKIMKSIINIVFNKHIPITNVGQNLTSVRPCMLKRPCQNNCLLNPL
jgi:E3 ubiquitin-protein ligase BAH